MTYHDTYQGYHLQGYKGGTFSNIPGLGFVKNGRKPSNVVNTKGNEWEGACGNFNYFSLFWVYQTCEFWLFAISMPQVSLRNEK